MNYANPEAWKDNAASEGINISGDFFPVYGALHKSHSSGKVSVRDMYNQAFDKVNGGDAFGYSFMVFMALIVEGHRSPIIGINPGSGNDGPAQISADIFNSDIRGARIGFGPDIKPIGMVFVNLVFKFLKRRSKFKGELLQKDFTESQAQEAIIKMSMRAPGSEVTSPALGNQGMDMRIPFQIPPEGMQDADKARSKVFGLVKLEEHTQDDIPDRMKQAVKKGMVLKKKDAEFFRNGKDTMPVNAGNQFTGHMKSPFLIIHVATGRTETAFTGKRDKFKVPTMRQTKKAPPKEGSWQWIILLMLSKTFLPGRSTYWMYSRWSEKIV